MPDYKLCVLFSHLFLLYYVCVDCDYFCAHTYIYIYCIVDSYYAMSLSSGNI